MTKPRCYFASHLGFSDVTRPWYQNLLEESGAIVEVVDPFAHVKEHHVAAIKNEQNAEARRLLLGVMARDLFSLIEESHMLVAIIDGEPPDTGMAAEVGFAYALNKVGGRQFPIIGFRSDSRSGGDGDLGFNAMFLPPMIDTGGLEIRGSSQDLIAGISAVAAQVELGLNP